ncbi:hypothetical protein [Halochromatium glycolicum]|uniref:DUF86 domain-containing protein n=1 Tax=Halochromatium glycolicum TaxID=85075 RepID=A0AAJ0UBA7_9GAMM|nr:hypothetical protein [Halochromatium glycolicum]MBK1707307.1 hypothetical protein [Halochromatium glycolicum]
MTLRRQVLAETMDALTQAAERLEMTHAGLAQHFPLSAAGLAALPALEQERLDAYAVRYARCQNLLAPAMRALARAQLEPKADGSFLELHALMQKQGLVGATAEWERLRSLRNAVGHEYPDPDSIVDILNGLRAETPAILELVERLRHAAAQLPT